MSPFRHIKTARAILAMAILIFPLLNAVSQAVLTYEDIKNGLELKLPIDLSRNNRPVKISTRKQLNDLIIDDIRIKGIGFRLTAQQEAELTRMGANRLLIAAIKNAAPLPKPEPPPIPVVVLSDLKSLAIEPIRDQPSPDAPDGGIGIPIALEIDEGGNVTSASRRSEVIPGLTDKAIELARAMKFRPATHQGKPAKASGILHVRFINTGSILSGADGLRAAGKCSAAITDYTKVLEAEPNNGKALYGRGYCYLVIANFGQAAANLNLFTTNNATDANGFYALGMAYDYMGDFRSAGVAYAKARELNPAMAQNTLWSCLSARRTETPEMKQEDDKLSATAASKEVGNAIVQACGSVLNTAADPFMSLVHYRRGVGYYYRAEFNEAINNFEKANSMTPGFQATREYLLDSYLGRGLSNLKKNGRLAVDDFSKAIDIAPQDARAYNQRCAANVRLEKVDEAIADCTKAISLFKDPPAAVFANRGIANQKKNLNQDALADFLKALSIDPKNEDARNGRKKLEPKPATSRSLKN